MKCASCFGFLCAGTIPADSISFGIVWLFDFVMEIRSPVALPGLELAAQHSMALSSASLLFTPKCYSFKLVPHCPAKTVAQAGLKFLILLSHPLQCLSPSTCHHGCYFAYFWIRLNLFADKRIKNHMGPGLEPFLSPVKDPGVLKEGISHSLADVLPSIQVAVL